ncbi:flagellar assembly protein FliH [Jannaschia helgolandensis]|uniref:Flagellar assembly protein FliH n=2 Tax=Jannaschia helgolandensis TaxID=188906 RepID=A0A1H7H118_9RHOB|nr:flagellar assembly protein FliH [Jannaschia helgolandensis]
MALRLEDFGTRGQAPGMASVDHANDRFDDGYNAGWDDAMAQVEAEQSRVAAQLAERLTGLERDQRAAMTTALMTLEPALRDVFDKLLPSTVERAFLPILLEEVEAVLDAGTECLTLVVAPEDAAPVARLLERGGIAAERVTVTSEPVLSMSQALIRWTGQERQIDLEGVLTALDDALETFLATMDRGQDAAGVKEALNG